MHMMLTLRCTYFWVEANHLVVATSVSTLAYHALGNTVETGKLDVIKLAVLVIISRIKPV